MAPRIHALPGTGADARMFPPPWDQLPQFSAHSWPHLPAAGSIAEVAAQLCAEFAIQDGDAIVGCSLGGIVAGEISKLRRLRRLILVGSAVSRGEISRILAFAHPLARHVPLDWLWRSARKLPFEVAAMFAGSDPEFVRAMCAAVFAWPGLGIPTCPESRVHGRFDLVIPPPPQADLLLNGGHLIAMTHASECVEFVRGVLEQAGEVGFNP